jgi:hypothetical protein
MILNLIISPLPLSPSGRFYEARLDAAVVCRSRTPFFSAARVLLKAGYAPDTVLTMIHEGSDTASLRATLGSAAKLAVVENSREGYGSADISRDRTKLPRMAFASRGGRP